MGIERRRLRIRGVVQGVGFRPFVYRTAVEKGLAGSVRNLGDAGVEVFIEGEAEELDSFIAALSDPPPLARIESISVEVRSPIGETGFSIVGSSEKGKRGGLIPADTAICDRCVADILGDSRYHGYWATSCTDCGPRFTVIESLPYDRPRTSMRDFPMCEACAAEYTDPSNRRYHAQTIACPECGPVLTFDGSPDRSIERAIGALRAGKIVAIKGIGGTHLTCDATDGRVVRRLRNRLGRPTQPFALMAADESMIRGFAAFDQDELRLLRSPQRPIVVLLRRGSALPEAIAPGLHTVGVMLPYTGLHYLLFSGFDRPLVMTSANLPDRPMLIENRAIEERLSGIADHFLLHDRRIVARCDDSVIRRSGDRFVFIRRSRGYVPEGLPVDLGDVPILALGPETGLTFALYADGRITPSQHIGSVDNLETYGFLLKAIDRLRRLLGIPEPKIVTCDLHPRFMTSRLAAEIADGSSARVVPVQHHVAHLLSVMGEADVDSAVGIVLDGYGYGLDGTAWGGEIIAASGRRIERVGSLAPIRLPGGDLATRYPLRVAASLLAAGGASQSQIERYLAERGLSEGEIAVVLVQLERGLNAPYTTSAGRFLDAVSAWLGICRERTYEGEPAMLLEATASSGTPVRIEVPISCCDGFREIDTVSVFSALVDLAEKEGAADVAASAQAAIADGTAEAAIASARERGIETIAFSGGVAYNDAIARRIRQRVEAAGLAYVTNGKVPCGDGGVSFGQAIFAGRGWEILKADRTDATPGDEESDGRKKD